MYLPQMYYAPPPPQIIYCTMLPRVVEAYLNPRAHSDPEPFEWPAPRLHRIRSYCAELFGWTEQQVSREKSTAAN